MGKASENLTEIDERRGRLIMNICDVELPYNLDHNGSATMALLSDEVKQRARRIMDGVLVHPTDKGGQALAIFAVPIPDDGFLPDALEDLADLIEKLEDTGTFPEVGDQS